MPNSTRSVAVQPSANRRSTARASSNRPCPIRAWASASAAVNSGPAAMARTRGREAVQTGRRTNGRKEGGKIKAQQQVNRQFSFSLFRGFPCEIRFKRKKIASPETATYMSMGTPVRARVGHCLHREKTGRQAGNRKPCSAPARPVRGYCLFTPNPPTILPKLPW